MTLLARWQKYGRNSGSAKTIGLALLIQFAATALPAQQGGIDTLFPARPTGFVTDVAGIIDPGSEEAATDMIRRLRAATTAEIAVVTLPAIGDYAESDVALWIGRNWGVGAEAEIGDPSRNNGVVLLIVPRQNGRAGTGKIFIATGRGVEGMITDAMAGRVRELMRPDLSREAYGPAVVTGVNSLAALIARGYGVSDSALLAAEPELQQRPREDDGPSGWLILIAVVVFLVISSLSNRGGGGRGGKGGRGRRSSGLGSALPWIILGGMMGGGGRGGGGFGGGGGGFGGGGFGGFGGGGGFSGGGAGGSF